uniref:Uncharacterized protein n=1 Tax=Panagrolaimus sp. JU765 TaxID=591449 RepID=A0AC34PVG9_9BILA
KLRGDPQIHRIFARIYWAQGDYNVARLHFLLANDPETFSQFLIDYTAKEGQGENDAEDYITQSVFLLLAYKKLRIAQSLFTIYCRDHPQIRQKFPFRNIPIFNFLWLLFAVLQANNFTLFVYLVDKYRPVLHGDCNHRDYLDKVGQIYFKIPPKNEGSGLLGGLLKGLLSKGTEVTKEEFSADEEMSEQATKNADQLSKVFNDFDALNSAADKTNPPGLIVEPNMESMVEIPESQKPSSSQTPTEMDLD